ncbi:glutaredoxin family protein [Aeromicrobium sp. CF3.5]|uniref:glutaredoxin family protein n=1 Tax=Aeromicrobium sp. CF3.5 TaxID=3373078 RepID=UPI003EE75663
MRRTLPAVALLLVAIAVVGSSLASGDYATGAVVGTILIAVGLLASPLPYPSSAGTEEWRRAEQSGDLVVMHRPGCPFCLRLRFSLGGLADRVTWVDIWADDEAAARVREATGGDETVPTVLVGGEAHVNPEPEWVRARLAS